MIDVAELLADPDFVQEVTLLRRTETLEAGVASIAEVPETIFASIQPASGEVLSQLPEGTQLTDVLMVYTATELHADGPGNQVADVIVDNGRRYVVRAVPEPFARFGYTGAACTADAMSGVRNAE